MPAINCYVTMGQMIPWTVATAHCVALSTKIQCTVKCMGLLKIFFLVSSKYAAFTQCHLPVLLTISQKIKYVAPQTYFIGQ